MNDVERQLRASMRAHADRLAATPRDTTATVERARRRRALTTLTAGAAAIALVLGGFAVGRSAGLGATVVPAERPTATTVDERVGFIGLPPVGATPSGTEPTELLVDYFGPDPFAWGKSHVWLYADGRLLFERDTTVETIGYVEQRLTPEGVDEVMSFVRANARPGDSGTVGTWIRMREGETLVEVYASGPVLAERLLAPERWLPESAWAQKQVRAYVPSQFSLCAEQDPASWFPDALPEGAARILRARPLVEPQGGEPPSLCAVVTTEEARTVLTALEDAGADRLPDVYAVSYVLTVRRGTAEVRDVTLVFEPLLPDGSFTCTSCG